jgi:8-oxo-dGTP diphosphatase
MDQPLISIDVVPLRLNRATRQVEVVLVRRAFEPSAGRLALPGVLLLSGELLDDAVHRALRDKAGIMREHVRAIGDVGVFDTPGRDPRGPTLSITKYVIVGDKFEPGEGVTFVALTNATGLPFDHDTIVKRAAGAVHDKLWVDRRTTEALIGQQFTTSDAANAQDALAVAMEPAVPPVNRINLFKSLKRSPWLGEPTEGAAAGEGRPAKAWEFV